MKKLLLTITLMLFGVIANADHLRGGQLYWEALGNNQYIFHFEGPAMCGTGQSSLAMTTTALLGGQITLNVSASRKLNGACNSCQYVELYHYQSAVITIPAPVTGPHYFNVRLGYYQDFQVDNVGPTSAGGNTNVVQSIMKVGGENKSAARFDIEQVLEQMTTNAIMLEPYSVEADSVWVAPYSPKMDTNTNLDGAIRNWNISSGYTPATPFSSSDIWLNEAGWLVSGLNDSVRYTRIVSMRIDQFEGSNWYSRTHMSLTMYRDANMASAVTNNNPSFVTVPSLGNWTQRDSVVQAVSAYLGERVELEINASDLDLTSTGSPQTVTAVLNEGSLKGSSYTLPTLSGVHNTGLSGSGAISVVFAWDVPATLPEGYYRFYVRIYDSECPAPGMITVPIVVYVNPIFNSSVEICSGGSAVLAAPYVGSVYQWLPNTALSNSTNRTTTANPTSSTTYYCVIDGDTAGVYSVLVGQNATPVVSQPQSNQIQLDNPQDFEEHALLYYLYPIAFNDTLFAANAQGDYNVVGKNLGCFDLSPTITILPDSSATSLAVSAPINRGSSAIMDAGDWYEMDVLNPVTMSGGGFTLTELIVPGAVAIDSSATLVLYVTSSAGADSLQAIDLDGHSMKFDLMSAPNFTSDPNLTFKLVARGGSVEVPLMSNMTFPIPHTYGEYTSADGVIDGDTITTEFMPVVMRGAYYVSLEEHQVNVSLYPQPASSIIYIDEIPTGAEFSMYSTNGVMVLSGQVGGDHSVDVSELTPGMYILHLTMNKETTTHKVLIQR